MFATKRACPWLLAAMLALPMAQAWAEAGRVEFVHGSASILDQSGQTHELSKGREIEVGDTLQTAGDGRVQIKFVDGGYISLQPNSSFKVEEYHYSGVVDGNERGIFRLIKGGLRAITGVIGHANKPAYRMDTPVATIGIRGTEFTALIDDSQKLIVKVGDGAVFMENAQGGLVLYKGQSGEVTDSGSRPGYSLVMPVLAAAGPQQASMQDTLEEKQTSAMADQGFVHGDMRDQSGMPCAVANCNSIDPPNPNAGGGNSGGNTGGGNTGGGTTPDPTNPTGVAAEILAANQAGITGSWSGSGNVAGAGLLGSFIWLNATGNLSVNFRNYEASFGLSLSGLAGVISRSTESNAIGTLQPDGSFVFNNGSMTGTGCLPTCTLVINSGSLSGTGLSRAGISFSVTDLLNLIAVNNQTLNLDRQNAQ